MKGSQGYFRCHVPHQRSTPGINHCLPALITLKDMSYESSQLKPKSNKMAEKRKISVIKDITSGEKNSERVDDIVELKRFRIRVIDSTYTEECCMRTRSSWGILFLYWNISIFILKKAVHLHHLRSQLNVKGRFRYYFEKAGLLKMSRSGAIDQDWYCTV